MGPRVCLECGTMAMDDAETCCICGTALSATQDNAAKPSPTQLDDPPGVVPATEAEIEGPMPTVCFGALAELLLSTPKLHVDVPQAEADAAAREELANQGATVIAEDEPPYGFGDSDIATDETVLDEPEPAPEALVARLRCVDGDVGVRLATESDRFVIGRDSSRCDHHMLDPRLSRVHAAITVVDGSAYVTDLGSSNGTRLNGAPITEATSLSTGDRIDLGRSSLIFEYGEL